jgi:nitrate reductase NapE component
MGKKQVADKRMDRRTFLIIAFVLAVIVTIAVAGRTLAGAFTSAGVHHFSDHRPHQ